MDGKIANSANGIANAKPKPNIPTAGPAKLPMLAASTSKPPMIGPVHENDTSTSVNAIKKMLKMPVVVSALLSILLDHEAGKVSSNAPKNDTANSTSSAKKIRLNTALVDKSFSALAPNSTVTSSPSPK
ncbi:hypothetical protein AGMMS49982_23850 [Bacteroidia bacterium]|nr:hypothetical protein AGMMS49982_23850 [Bacteroidia bacterium]